MKSKNVYEKPQVKDDVKIIEPVETGCCLRSCGGSPHHLNTNKKTNLEKLFEKNDK